MQRYDKWWKEGYKAGTINLPVPGHCTPRYRAGYAAGLAELKRLMESGESDAINAPWRHKDGYRPPNFDKWEVYVLSGNCLARCIIKREDMYALLRYVRRLERDVAELGSFW